MTKPFKSISIAVLVASGLLAVAPHTAMADPLRVSLQTAAGHGYSKSLLRWEACTEALVRDLDIEIYPDGQLYRDRQAPEMVSSGAVEMVVAPLSKFAIETPLAFAPQAPFLFDTEDSLRAAMAPESAPRQAIDAAVMAGGDIRILWWLAGPRAVLLARAPIRAPAELVGQPVRTLGRLALWTATALDAAPTRMSAGRQYLAFQQGAVMAGFTSLDVIARERLYEVAPHLTLTFHSADESVAVINETVFQSLSKETAAAMAQCGAQEEALLRDQRYADELAILARLRAEMSVIDLTPEDRAVWRAAAAPARERLARKVGGEIDWLSR